MEPSRQLMTHSVTSPPSIAALRKVHWPLMLGIPRQLRLLVGRERGRAIPSADVNDRDGELRPCFWRARHRAELQLTCIRPCTGEHAR